jgi:archaellum biogenesis ATPase FlaH
MRCHQTFPARSPTLLELQDVTRGVLVEILKTYKVYLVIDALDEVAWGAQREDLLRFLRKLPAIASEGLRVLVSSRNESDIRDTFCHPESRWTDIPVDLKDVDKDIEKYIDNGMEKHRSLKRQSSATKSLIREKLIQNANGMYVTR